MLLEFKEVLCAIENSSEILRWKLPQKTIKERWDQEGEMNKEEVMKFNFK